MRFLFIIFIVFFNTQLHGVERVVRGYSPLMLSDLFSVHKNQDRSLLAKPIKRWVRLDELLTPDELKHYSISGQKTVWIDKCKRAERSALRNKVTSWLTNQSWSNALKIHKVTITNKRLCSDWLKIENFSLLNSQYIGRNISLVNIDKSLRSLNVTLSADYRVLVSKEKVGANTLLQRNMLVNIWKELKSSVNLTDLTIDLKRDWKTRKPIDAGKSISSSMLVQSAIVEVGDQVTAFLVKGSLTIDVTGRALGRGYLGDQILILVDGAKSPIKGKVVNKGVVKIGA
ncbi:flagellar basal body P-ring formation chaperone FlgA [Shewanella woodyi]|uniref:flagellar basal body P-ring formation chaperone FlgA n=1 Tax=Shewanella woodyi TaxID=60961 RepID=UPI0037497B88